MVWAGGGFRDVDDVGDEFGGVGEGTFCEETGEHCLANARVTSDYNGWHRERVCSVVAAGGAAA